MEKLVTFKITSPSGGFMISHNMADLLTGTFGCDNDGTISPATIEASGIEIDDDEEIEYTITIEKKYTQKELDEMPESDGDIH
jgi:hypothetical protein